MQKADMAKADRLREMSGVNTDVYKRQHLV